MERRADGNKKATSQLIVKERLKEGEKSAR